MTTPVDPFATPNPRASSPPLTDSATINTIVGLILPIIFKQMSDPRWANSFGGGGSFRPSDNYMRHVDAAERQSAMGLRSEPQIAAEVRRLTSDYVQRYKEQWGYAPSQEEIRGYAGHPDVRKAAKDAATQAVMQSEKTSVDNLTQMYYNIDVMSERKEDLTDARRKELMEAAREKAVKTRETMAKSPMVMGLLTQAVGLAERHGAVGLSNLDPKLFIGGGMFDAMRAASPFAFITPGVAGDLSERIAGEMFKGGVYNYEFTHGRSALQTIDAYAYASRMGMTTGDLGGVAQGRYGTVGSATYEAETAKIMQDVSEITEVYESMEDLFGPGGSFAEMFQRVERMTSGAVRTMTKEQVNRVVRDAAYLSQVTGKSVEQIEGMMGVGSDYLSKSGIRGDLQTRLLTKSIEEAYSAVGARGGKVFHGARTADELSGDILMDKISGMQSADLRSVASMLEATRVHARGLGIQGVDDMDPSKLFDTMARAARARGADSSDVYRLRRVGQAFKNVAAGVGSTEDIRLTSAQGAGDVMALIDRVLPGQTSIAAYYQMSRELQGPLVEAELERLDDHLNGLQMAQKRQHIITAAAAHIVAASPRKMSAEEAQQARDRYVHRFGRAHDLLLTSNAASADEAVAFLTSDEARKQGLHMSREEASVMVNMMDKMFIDMPGEQAGVFGYMNRYGRRARHLREEWRSMSTAWEKKDKQMRAAGVGRGSVMQKLIGNLMQDPTSSLAENLAPLLTGEVNEEEFAAAGQHAKKYASAQRDITERLLAGEITAEQAEAERARATDQFTEGIKADRKAQQEIAEMQRRGVPDKQDADDMLQTIVFHVGNIKTLLETAFGFGEDKPSEETQKDAEVSKGDIAEDSKTKVAPDPEKTEMAANIRSDRGRSGRRGSGTTDATGHLQISAVDSMTGTNKFEFSADTGAWHGTTFE